MKRFDYRIVLGVVLVLAGGLLLLQTMGYLEDATDWFWGAAFLIAGAAFLSLLANGQWWAVFPGMPLVGLGLTILLPDSLDELGGFLFLGSIGVAFWLVYFMDRSRWWALIPAGVLTTLAVVAALPSRIGGFAELNGGGVFFLGLALTFLLVALVAGMRWAYWPAAILGVLGVLIMVSVMSFANYIWAAALIVIGGYLVYRFIANR